MKAESPRSRKEQKNLFFKTHPYRRVGLLNWIGISTFSVIIILFEWRIPGLLGKFRDVVLFNAIMGIFMSGFGAVITFMKPKNMGVHLRPTQSFRNLRTKFLQIYRKYYDGFDNWKHRMKYQKICRVMLISASLMILFFGSFFLLATLLDFKFGNPSSPIYEVIITAILLGGGVLCLFIGAGFVTPLEKSSIKLTKETQKKFQVLLNQFTNNKTDLQEIKHFHEIGQKLRYYVSMTNLLVTIVIFPFICAVTIPIVLQEATEVELIIEILIEIAFILITFFLLLWIFRNFILKKKVKMVLGGYIKSYKDRYPDRDYGLELRIYRNQDV